VIDGSRVGNTYVNRNMIGAVVGVQPFGGERLSGTGPKAGGPFYLAALGGPLGKELESELERRLERDRKPLDRQPDLRKLDAIAAEIRIDPAPGLPPELRAELIAFIDLARQASLASRTIELAGPTGESNTLSFHPRRRIVCVAEKTADLAAQLIAVLAAGGTPYVEVSASSGAVADALPRSLHGALEPLQPDTEIDAVLIAASAEAQKHWRVQVAERHAAIVPVVCWDLRTDPRDALWRLFHERCVSVNTTAAGGNASLATLTGI
jgi:RHH-type proline utilization regulon transcriptional repressor/proline dehydrogenase/delta 1-pyrroline-5-carboxylate dehydrogenase